MFICFCFLNFEDHFFLSFLILSLILFCKSFSQSSYVLIYVVPYRFSNCLMTFSSFWNKILPILWAYFSDMLPLSEGFISFSSHSFLCWYYVVCGVLRRRQWHPTPVLWPGKSYGRRSLVGCSPCGGHDWVTPLSLFTFMHWRRKWQPTPVFLPGESQGRQSLVGWHLWGCTESDTTETT